MEILKNFLILFLLLTPLISCKQHPERNEKMTDFISTGSTYWIPDEEFKWLEIAAKNGHPIAQSNLADLFFTQGNKEKAIFWAKKAYINGAKLPDELKILININ